MKTLHLLHLGIMGEIPKRFKRVDYLIQYWVGGDLRIEESITDMSFGSVDMEQFTAISFAMCGVRVALDDYIGGRKSFDYDIPTS